MPDFDRMMYQTPFWSGSTMGGRDVYAPGIEPVTGGQVQRWVLPQFDSGNGGWAGPYQQPGPGDPALLNMGFQQTGIYGGPGGYGELYSGPQTPPFGVPVGFSQGFDGVPASSRTSRLRSRQALRAARRAATRHGLSGRGLGAIDDTAALGLVAGLFVGVPALIGWLGARSSSRRGGWKRPRRAGVM